MPVISLVNYKTDPRLHQNLSYSVLGLVRGHLYNVTEVCLDSLFLHFCLELSKMKESVDVVSPASLDKQNCTPVAQEKRVAAGAMKKKLPDGECYE